MGELLQAHEIFANYGREDVLQRVSFRMRGGELCALLGSNGSGKSTLLRCVCGLLPFDGSITLEGENLLQMRQNDRARRIGYLSQSGNITPALSALGIVLMGLNPTLGLFQSPGPNHRKRALEVMEQVGADQFADWAFPTLSQGQKQLVLLARTLVCHPRLVVLDEPDSALDFRNRQKMMELLKEYSGSCGQGVLLCSHDINIALAYADHLLLLKSGTLAYDLRLPSISREQLQSALRDIYGPVEVFCHKDRYLMVMSSEKQPPCDR